MLLLTKVREDKGLSKSALARKAELNATTICNIENGYTIAREKEKSKIALALGWEDAAKDILFERAGGDSAEKVAAEMYAQWCDYALHTERRNKKASERELLGEFANRLRDLGICIDTF